MGQGEYYPCKADIFEATYEPATEEDLVEVPRHLLDALYEMAHSLSGEGYPILDEEREALKAVGRLLGKSHIMGEKVCQRKDDGPCGWTLGGHCIVSECKGPKL